MPLSSSANITVPWAALSVAVIVVTPADELGQIHISGCSESDGESPEGVYVCARLSVTPVTNWACRPTTASMQLPKVELAILTTTVVLDTPLSFATA
jgi:hypothetical protein